MAAMSALLTEIVIESTDPPRAAAFWSRALGWELHEYMPGNVPWMSASGQSEQHDLKLVFVPVRDGRPPGSRLYLNPVGCELAEEVDRLASLGARSDGEGSTNPWVAMVDPGGIGLTVLPTRID
jgi:catechol 2,3-dioxygenase-like lactoylglutathione lyase family enzyme